MARLECADEEAADKVLHELHASEVMALRSGSNVYVHDEDAAEVYKIFKEGEGDDD